MTSLFEENERIFDDLEQAEHCLEKIRIEGADSAEAAEKCELAGSIKSLVSRLVRNIEVSQCKVERLGGAVVLLDLAEVLERYEAVFDIPGLTERLDEVRTMIEQAG